MSLSERTTGVESERTVLVGVYINAPVNAKDPLSELSGLAITAGAQVVAELVQRRHEPDQQGRRPITARNQKDASKEYS